MGKNFQGYNLVDFDFLDLGSGTGESIELCEKRFNAKAGLGVDIKESKVIAARQRNIPTIHADILKTEIPHKFKFVSMMDFLEHLPSKDHSAQIIEKAAYLATDFLFIRHPSFEHLDYLKNLGLKITWYDWTGHTSLLTITDYCQIFNKLGLKQYCFNFKRPIEDTNNAFIVPHDVPTDTVKYDSRKHGKKKLLKFEPVIYSMIDIFVALKPFELVDWAQLTNIK